MICPRCQEELDEGLEWGIAHICPFCSITYIPTELRIAIRTRGITLVYDYEGRIITQPGKPKEFRRS
jgi:hypothetical protein